MNPALPPSTKRLSSSDAIFLTLETRDTPTHIAVLQVFSLPPAAPPDFIKRVVQRFRNPTALARPFNLKLLTTTLSRVVPAMIEDKDIDLDYHVRHSALPDPGGERELGELISHLHGQALDRSRPLWTCHVIEGLHDRRFAIYTKMHHALADGISAVRMVTRALATDPAGEWSPVWEQRKSDGKAARPSSKAPAAKLSARDWSRQMAKAFRPLFKREPGAEPVLRSFEAPRSVLNGRVTNARRVATQQLDVQRMKRIGKQAGGTLNDVFLAVCSAALRRYLLAQDALPEQSLVAAVPVSLREAGDETPSNQVGLIYTRLATDIADPRERYAAICASSEASKAHLKSLPAPARAAFAQLNMVPTVLSLLSGMAARLRPAANIGVSNVPGPTQPLYLDGAQMLAIYPPPILMQGQALNITCISYAGQLNVGVGGSRDRVPHLQKLAVYLGEALDELEAAHV